MYMHTLKTLLIGNGDVSPLVFCTTVVWCSCSDNPATHTKLCTSPNIGDVTFPAINWLMRGARALESSGEPFSKGHPQDLGPFKVTFRYYYCTSTTTTTTTTTITSN